MKEDGIDLMVSNCVYSDSLLRTSSFHLCVTSYSSCLIGRTLVVIAELGPPTFVSPREMHMYEASNIDIFTTSVRLAVKNVLRTIYRNYKRFENIYPPGTYKEPDRCRTIVKDSETSPA